MSFTIRAAIPDDAPALSRFGAMTFRDTFGGENTPDDMARYLSDAFSPTKQSAEIADPAGGILLAENRDGAGTTELVGYAHLIAADTPAAVRGPAPIELKRLYVARTWHGRRVAQHLMDACLDTARARGARTLWLGVWERNARAVAFYMRYGFERVGEHTFVLGADPQTGWLLSRAVESVGSRGDSS